MDAATGDDPECNSVVRQRSSNGSVSVGVFWVQLHVD